MELNKKLKNFIIYNIILKIKRPVHKGLELKYYLFFNKFIKKRLTKLILIFLKFYYPVYNLKFFLHNIFEHDLNDSLDVHIIHSFIIGLYLWIFLIQYVSFIYLLYILKVKFLKKKLNFFKKKNKINTNLIILNLELCFLNQQNIII